MMPVARFQLPDGRIARFEVPEGTSPEQAQSLMEAELPNISGSVSESEPTTPQPKPRIDAAEEPGMLDNIALAVDRGLNAIGEGARARYPLLPSRQNIVDAAAGASGIMRGTSKMLGMGEGLWPTSAANKESTARTVGAMLDPASWAIAGGVGKLIPMAPVLGKGAWNAAKAIGQNALSGGVTGGVIGGLDDNGSAGTGATTGAVAGALLPTALEATGRGAGLLIDAVKGRVAQTRAGKVLRDVAGDNAGKFRAAWAAAPDDLTASQAAAGIDDPVMAALGQRAAQNDSRYTEALRGRQQQAMIDEVSRVAGGATQTEAKATREASKNTLNAITTPMRETEIGAANTAGEVIKRLDPLIAQKEAAKISALQDTGRLYSLEGQTRAALNGKLNSATPGWVKPETISSLEDNVLKARAGTQAMNAMKWQRQDEAAFLQMQKDSLAAHGLKPLDTKGMIASINSRLDDPKIGVSDINRRVLTKVGRKIQEWTDKGGGIIDGNALVEIRKNAVNEEVKKLMQGADPTSQAKRAAGILREVKPIIDDAIKTAGGTEWQAYLKTFEDGMNVINQKKLGAVALDMLKTSPKDFQKLARGDNPDAVSKVFETQFDINAAMGASKKPIDRVADQLARDDRLAELATIGGTELSNILNKDALKFSIPNLLWRPAMIANKAADIAESSLNVKTMEEVYRAMRTGKGAAELIDTLPTAERSRIIKAIMDSRKVPYLTGGIVAGEGE